MRSLYYMHFTLGVVYCMYYVPALLVLPALHPGCDVLPTPVPHLGEVGVLRGAGLQVAVDVGQQAEGRHMDLQGQGFRARGAGLRVEA